MMKMSYLHVEAFRKALVGDGMMRYGEDYVASSRHRLDAGAAESIGLLPALGRRAREFLLDGPLDHLRLEDASVETDTMPATNKRLFRWIHAMWQAFFHHREKN